MTTCDKHLGFILVLPFLLIALIYTVQTLYGIIYSYVGNHWYIMMALASLMAIIGIKMMATTDKAEPNREE